MFDRTILVRQPDVHVHNRVEQKPHDAADAARLYGECMAKAQAEVLNATIVKLGAHNEITAAKVQSQESFMDRKLYVRLLFSVNGQNHDITVEDTPEAMAHGVYQELVIRLFDKVMGEVLKPFKYRLGSGSTSACES